MGILMSGMNKEGRRLTIFNGNFHSMNGPGSGFGFFEVSQAAQVCWALSLSLSASSSALFLIDHDLSTGA